MAAICKFMQMYLGDIVIVVLIDSYRNVDERRAETKELRKYTKTSSNPRRPQRLFVNDHVLSVTCH